MAADLRIDLDFLIHPKTKRLENRLNREAILCLIELWVYAGKFKTKGNLTEMSISAIETAANWGGEPGQFVQTLVDLRFLDEKNGSFMLHNWKKRQGFLYYANERSGTARKAAKARWDKAHKELDPMRNVCDPHTSSISHAYAPSPTPTPIPSPAPNPKNKDSHARTSSPHDRLQIWIESEQGQTWLSEQITIYSKDFVEHESLKASNWVKDYPIRGNKKNWQRFLGHWFKRGDESRSRKETQPPLPDVG